MNLTPARTLIRRFPIFNTGSVRFAAFWLWLICIWPANLWLAAAEPVTGVMSKVETNATPCFKVSGFTVEGRWLLSTNTMVRLFSKYAGTNVSLTEIVQAASDLELEYIHEGYPTMNIVVAPKRITNGIVTLDAFPGAVAQVVVSGNRYLVSSNGVVMPPPQQMISLTAAPVLTKTTPAVPPNTATNAGPRFSVNKYQIAGNTLLPPESVGLTLTNAPGAFGTNVSIDAIRQVVAQLDAAYRARGYVTVAVGLPPQRLTNAEVKLQVTEGRLSDILVKGNHYFSSNNVMRALPGLYPGMILNGLTFQAEVNRANANQDRQIYSLLEPGPDPGTSDLTLTVKDRLPLHAKAELNNQSSPGTPELRINTSATYNNLWDLEHALGLQYGFSPWHYKVGPQWNFYDIPLVANYSAFYRMPLGNPDSVDATVASDPGSFGYDEATRKFKLPPASGQPELNIYASRSTIDTGIENLATKTLYNIPGVRTITESDDQQDLTVNNDIGTRLSGPLATKGNFHWDISGGVDFKTFETASYKTNSFLFSETTLDQYGRPNPPTISKVASPVPTTDRPIEYLPLALNLNGNWRTPNTTLSWGLGLSGNVWYSGTTSNLHGATGSTKSTGYWIVATPSISWQFPIHTNWLATIRADGQLTSEPLISSEQFGAGGINSVRGYHEGEVFGDDGWHVGFEQLTPPQMVGMVFGKTPLVVRGSLYMDYAHTYLIDPQGRPDGVALWGTGVGCVASIGSFWESRFWFSVPLLKCPTAGAYEPYFNFSLTAQF